MGIEYHHIHHMNAKIPGYNLQKYHEEVVSKSNMFDNVVKLSMTDCYNNLWLVLYDEEKKRYITYYSFESVLVNTVLQHGELGLEKKEVIIYADNGLRSKVNEKLVDLVYNFLG